MPFGSLGVRPQPIVEQQIPNYAQWDWDFAGKAQKGMESTYKMTQDAQNQPLLRDKQALENMLEEKLFPTKLTEASAQIEQIKADTNYRNAMAQRALGEASTLTSMGMGEGSLPPAYQNIFNKYQGFPSSTAGASPSAPASPAPAVTIPTSLMWNRQSTTPSFKEFKNKQQ